MSSTFFRSLLADAVGLPLEVSPLGSYISAYGAARLAATASGVPEPATAVQGDRPATTDPAPGSEAAWQALAERHDALLAAIRS